MAFAATAVVNWIYLWTDRRELLHPNGMLGSDYLRTIDGYFSVLEFASTAAQVNGLMFVALASIICVALGWKTRLATILSYIWHMSYVYQLGPMVSGWDFVHVIVNFVLMISPCAAVWSLDAEKARKQTGTKTELIPCYAYRLLQLQFFLMFFATTWLKSHNYPWQHGIEVGHFFLGSYTFFNTTLVLQMEKLNNLLTHLTLLIELVVPFFLWNRKGRFLGYVMIIGLMGSIATARVAIYALITLTLSLSFLERHDLEALRDFFAIKSWKARIILLWNSAYRGLFVFFGRG